MTTTALDHSVPTGTWELDPVHSHIGFEVEYLVGTFRGELRDVEATLSVVDDELVVSGSARVAGIDVKDENLSAHLQSPEFFDAERHPELRFASTELAPSDGAVAVRGELTMKGVTRPVELEGTISEPATDPYGRERVGLKLTTTVDRTDFGIDWNAPLPSGGQALANDVTLVAELYFTKAA